MPDITYQTPSESDEHPIDLELLGLLLHRAEAANQLIDPVTMPRSHAAVQRLLSQLGHEIEQATVMRDH